MPAGRPPKYETPGEMQRLVDLYFIACKHNHEGNKSLLAEYSDEESDIIINIEDEVPTVCGLALVLDLTRQGFIEYGGKEEFSDTVKKAKQRIERFLEQRLYSNSPVGTIFNLKNNFGWRDAKEISGPGGGAIEYKNATDEELENKIISLTRELDADTDNT